MSPQYVFFRDDPASKKEVYLTRLPKGGFRSVPARRDVNIEFDTASDAYQFGKQFPKLQSWKVGQR